MNQTKHQIRIKTLTYFSIRTVGPVAARGERRGVSIVRLRRTSGGAWRGRACPAGHPVSDVPVEWLMTVQGLVAIGDPWLRLHSAREHGSVRHLHLLQVHAITACCAGPATRTPHFCWQEKGYGEFHWLFIVIVCISTLGFEGCVIIKLKLRTGAQKCFV